MKQLYMMRGVSGSGKSTMAKTLVGNGVILSTDDFWIQDGVYVYDKARIGEAHRWNEERAFRAFEEGVSPVVIDNTNITAFYMRSYVEVALRFGYEVVIVEPTTPWAFNAEELTNDIPGHAMSIALDKMLAAWEPNLTVEKIEKAMPPVSL